MSKYLEERRKENERIKKQYPSMTPFVSDVTRSTNIRVNNPLCPVWPYEQH